MTPANENVTENGDQNYKAPMGLKILVVALGVAIVLMLGLIIVKVIAGDHKKPKQLAEAEEKGVISAPVVRKDQLIALKDLSVARPEGGKLVSVAPNGLDLVLRFTMPDGSDELVIVNRATGSQTRVSIPK